MRKIIFSLTCIFFIYSIHAAAVLQVVHLTTEYLVDPLGISEIHPRLSWMLKSTQRNQGQSAYELQVGELENFRQRKGMAWESGKIVSTQNTNVAYQGSTLQSNTRYYWRVKVYDANGEASEWSTPAFFETAFLKNDWKAKWISDNRKQFEKDEDFYQDDPMPLFRKEFNSSKKILTARLYISGLGYYEAWLNGKKIGDHVLDPGFTTYRKQVLYATYDITKEVKQGSNVFGVMLGNGWYNPLPLQLFGRFNLRDVQQTGRPCVTAQILIRYADGSSSTINTDESWHTSTGPVIRNNVYLGERYDARLEKQNWSNSGAHDAWKNHAVFVNGPTGVLTPQLLPPIRVTKTIQPASIRETGKDTFIVDMGQNFAGVARIRVKGNAGTKISLRYGEAIHGDGRLNYFTTVAGQIKEIWKLNGGPGAPKTAWQQDDYIMNGSGEETWAPRFTFHGFRYVEITGWPGKPGLSDIQGLRMNSDLEGNGEFSCSNDFFNKLNEVIRWTFLSNVFSVQSDCPAREKMGYGADIVVTADAFLYNFNMSQFYAKTIRDFANEQQEDGGITELAPYTGIHDKGYGGESGPLGWQLAFPWLQKQLYTYYGDKRIIEQQYPAVKKQIAFLQSKAINGLFYWDISDHEALDTKPEAFSAAAFYYHHVLLAADFAGILGETSDSLNYASLADNIKSSIIHQYAVPRTGRIDNATQSAQILALWYELTPEKQLSLDVLENEFKRHQMHLSTGIFSTKMLFDVLRTNEKNEWAYTIANQRDFPGWGYMLEKGATTLWESWAYSDNVYSQNHPMFGSVSEWFFRSLLGINPAAPGFKKILLKPQPVSDLQWARGTYQSIYGPITSDWKKHGNDFLYSISIPPNTTAEVWIPTKENEPVKESGKAITEAEGVRVLRYREGHLVVNVGSGMYQFRSRW